MGLQSSDTERVPDSQDTELSEEIHKILESARRQVEDEFRRRLESAVRDAGSAALKSAETGRVQALLDARAQVSAELQEQFGETLRQTTSRLEAEFEQRLNASAAEWETEKARLTEEMKVLRAYADTQRQMSESHSQAEILGHFLDQAEKFAADLAVYVAKPEGLSLWKTRGTATFPQMASKSTIDSDAYFKPIVVRDRVIAAVCARHPFQSESLDVLSGILAQAIELFGAKLQNRAAKP